MGDIEDAIARQSDQPPASGKEWQQIRYVTGEHFWDRVKWRRQMKTALTYLLGSGAIATGLAQLPEAIAKIARFWTGH
jgi:hypothetical protein